VITDGGISRTSRPRSHGLVLLSRTDVADIQKHNHGIGNKIAEAAAAMTDTTVTRRIASLPSAFCRPMAKHRNAPLPGAPVWTADEQAFAKAVQKNLGAKEQGLTTKLDVLKAPDPKPESGGSDDIGDVSWTVPTIVVRYPSNIPDLPGHHWANAIAMATPIAHKGVVAGSKVVAMTTLDLLASDKLRRDARDYFDNAAQGL
jgi:aminobenzoyl-glutamate utilization protein B